ncbi:MAG: ATP-binding protein, partial [Desulfosarcinaceae bacterium]
PDIDDREITLLRQAGLASLAYFPLIDHAKKTYAVIRIGSKHANHFGTNEVRALELISNRIGVAIQNALLEEDIRRRVNFQARLIGSSNDGIVATDEKWRIMIFNPTAESIFGLPKDDVVGRVDARKLYPPSVCSAFEALTAGTVAGSLPWQETTLRTEKGEEIPVRFSGSVLKEKYKMMGTVAFFQDLREIKRLEKELLGAERLAAVGQTVAGMAHCVKNILHGFKGGSYILNQAIEKSNPEKLKAGWEMVQRNIVRTSALVQDLLSYSKEREPEVELCEPNEIAAEVCELLRHLAEEHAVKIEQQLDPQIGEVLLDPRSLHRSLMNLVSNAIDACRDDDAPDKDHRVIVTTARGGDGWVGISVTDNGSGMTEEVKDKLFTSFFSTKGVQGTGLGLLVTSKLIEEHKGTIDVDSRWGEGTTFTLRLPVAGNQQAAG